MRTWRRSQPAIACSWNPPIRGQGICSRAPNDRADRRSMMKSWQRRDFLAASLGLGTAASWTSLVWAAETLVAATFPGTWNEAHSKVLGPWFKKMSKADLTLTIQLATDQVAKLAAAGGKPPFD